MLKTFFIMLCAVGALLLVGCYKSATTNNNNSMAGDKPAGASSSPAAASGEKVGVAECDEFIAAYDACVSKNVPEAAKAQYKAMLTNWRDEWRKAAATPQGKAGLAQACKMMIEQQRTAMKSYNCTF
jgi:hypothetical protein